MKKILYFLLAVTICSCTGLYAEIKYQMFSSFLVSDMNEQDMDNYIEVLHDGMLNREENIVLDYRGSDEDLEAFVVNMISNAFEIDNKESSSDYDYMRYIHSASHVNMTGWGKKYKVTYSMEYLESKEQTEQVDKKVAKILKKLNVLGMSDYNKVKAIHDYVIDNVTYDMSTNFNSPYYALMEGTSACQGYAVLIYKMLTEADISCRVITGKAKGGLHAWNLVKIDDKWYNLDATWDDPVGLFGKSAARYRYFLKTDREMTDHKRDKEFTTDQFNNDFPMAMKSYGK